MTPDTGEHRKASGTTWVPGTMVTTSSSSVPTFTSFPTNTTTYARAATIT